MSQHSPTVDDYLRIFDQYGKDMDRLYMDPPDDRYELLFEHTIRLLVKPSPFNIALPEPFRRTAFRYHDGDPETVRQLADRDTRHFMLSDVYDYILLTGGLARRRTLSDGGA